MRAYYTQCHCFSKKDYFFIFFALIFGGILGHVGYMDDVVTALDTSLAVVVSQDVSPERKPYVSEGTAIDLYLGKH